MSEWTFRLVCTDKVQHEPVDVMGPGTFRGDLAWLKPDDLMPGGGAGRTMFEVTCPTCGRCLRHRNEWWMRLCAGVIEAFRAGEPSVSFDISSKLMQ